MQDYQYREALPEAIKTIAAGTTLSSTIRHLRKKFYFVGVDNAITICHNAIRQLQIDARLPLFGPKERI